MKTSMKTHTTTIVLAAGCLAIGLRADADPGETRRDAPFGQRLATNPEVRAEMVAEAAASRGVTAMFNLVPDSPYVDAYPPGSAITTTTYPGDTLTLAGPSWVWLEAKLLDWCLGCGPSDVPS